MSTFAHRIAHAARIYARLQALHLRTFLEYEADFWIGILGTVLTHGAGIVFLWAFFSRVPTVGGWTAWQIAFLYALSIIPRGLVEVLCDGQWQLRALVNTGEFDRLLLRPLSPALQVVAQEASIHGFGSILLGAIVLARASVALHLAWDPARAAYLLAVLGSSVVMIGALNLATNCVAFWEPSATGTFPFLVQNVLELAKFPLTLYGRLVQVLLTWALPFAFVSYYPGLVLLGRPSPMPALGVLAPLSGPAVAIVASLVWRRGVARYQGAGH